MKTRFVVLALLTIFTLAARAEAPLKMVGKARLNILFWSIYDIVLFTADGQYAPNSLPVELKITYLRDFTAQSLVERTGEEWQKQGVVNPALDQWLTDLHNIWPDIAKGDSLEFAVDCSGNGRFYFNDKFIGGINDVDFSNNFLAIWLSGETSQPTMRRKLLGDRLVPYSDNATCK